MKVLFLLYMFLIIILILLTGETRAQLGIDVQLRNRFEIKNGYQKLASEGLVTTAHIAQRTRVSFFYKNDHIIIIFTPQDVRVWGDENIESTTGVFGDDASISLFEGYAGIRLGSLGWVSTGRQQLVYDNKRILGNRNWNHYGIAYDAVVLKLVFGDMNIHTGSTWNSSKESVLDNYYPSNRIKSLSYLWANKTYDNKFQLSALHVTSGVTRNDTSNIIHFRHTSGCYGEYKTNRLRIMANAYYQYGRNRNGWDVSAFLIDADGYFLWDNLKAGAGLGYLSGNKYTGDRAHKDHLFDVLYGNRHSFFGYMDYFRDFYTHTKQGGLIDLYAYVGYNLSKSLSLKNTGHYFSLAQTNPTTPENRNLGFENDLTVEYRFNTWGTLDGGYMFFQPTPSLKIMQHSEENRFSYFIYLQLSLNISLLSHNLHPDNH